jgi:serine/threonine protein kinase
MTDPEITDALLELLDRTLADLRSGRTIDLAAWREQFPEHLDHLPKLLETVQALETAVEDWRGAATLLETFQQVIDEPFPTEIGRFKIDGILGSGGMGTVYKAHDPQLDRAVAVKVPHFDMAPSAKAMAVQRFLREAKVAARVRHPNVCPMYDVGEADGRPYVVMAFIEGQSLKHLLKSGPLDPAPAADLVAKVALGLEAVHKEGIVHRDVKPANIMLDAAGHPYLTDFGLARPISDKEALTQHGLIVGTPGFMAPEQAQSASGPIGPWTDVFSLGMVLYNALAGQLPFSGPALHVLLQNAAQDPPPPSKFRPGLDAGLEAIVMKAVARDARARYQSAGEMRHALEKWLAHPVRSQRSLRAIATESAKAQHADDVDFVLAEFLGEKLQFAHSRNSDSAVTTVPAGDGPDRSRHSHSWKTAAKWDAKRRMVRRRRRCKRWKQRCKPWVAAVVVTMVPVLAAAAIILPVFAIVAIGVILLIAGCVLNAAIQAWKRRNSPVEPKKANASDLPLAFAKGIDEARTIEFCGGPGGQSLAVTMPVPDHVSKVEVSAIESKGKKSKRPRLLLRMTIAMSLIFIGTAAFTLLYMLRPLPMTSVVVLGASYDVNLSLPHNAHGWQGLSDLAQVASRGSHMWLEYPRGESVQVRDEASWQKQWKDALRAKINGKTVLLYLALHGGADAEGAYLFLNEPRLKEKVYVRTLLDDIVKQWPSRNIVLILEPGPLDAHWQSGMFENQFVPRLKAAVDAVAENHDKLLVLCGCDDNQVCWSSDEWRRTIFTHYLAEGLRGAAAKDDNSVTVGTLFDYVKGKVAGWAEMNRGMRQTPVLLGNGSRNTELTKITATYTEQSPQAAPGLSPFTASHELTNAWVECTKLASSAHPAAYTPQEWRRYRDALVRWEQLERAGDPTGAAPVLQRVCTRLVTDIVSAVGVPAAGSQITGSLPLPGAMGTPFPWPRDELEGRFSLLWNATGGDKQQEVFQKLVKWSEVGTDKAKAHLLFVALCQELLHFVSTSNAVERPEHITSKAVSLARFLEREFQLPRPAEVHFLIMLGAGLDAKAIPPIADLRQSLEVRILAEQAALAAHQALTAAQTLVGPASDLVASPSYSEIVHPFIRNKVETADGSRRLAEDWLFGASEKEWKRARELRGKATVGYHEALEDAAVIRRAVSKRDRALADLPYFAAWLGARLSHAHAKPEAALVKLKDQVEELSQHIGDLTWCLSQPNLTVGFREPFDSPRKGEAQTPKQFMEQLAKDMKERHDGLHREFAAHCNALRRVNSQEEWHQLESALSVPLIPKTSDRDALLQASHRISLKLHQAEPSLAEAQRPAPDPDRLEHRKQLALAALVANSEDKHPVGLHAKASAAILAPRIGAYWGDLPDRIVKQAGASDRDLDLHDAAVKMRHAEFWCRLLPGGIDLADKFALSPPASMRRLRLHDLLVSQAERTKADHWYDEDGRPFYVPAATSYTRLALDLVPSDGRNLALAAARRSKTEGFEKSLTVAGLKLVPPANLDWTSELIFPLKWTLDADEGVPRGVPVYWFQTKHEATNWYDDATGRVAVAEWDKQKTRPLEHNLKGGERTELQAVALFRGQRALGPVAVHKREVRTVVEHFPPQKSGVAFRMGKDVDYGAICFMIDCSSSMRNNKVRSTGRERRLHAIEALEKALEAIPENTFVSVLGFETAPGGTQPEYKLIYAPQRWKARDRATVVRDLHKLQFTELSPLAWAIAECLERGFDHKNHHGTKLIVALTDGDDDFSFGEDLSRPGIAADVLDRHADKVREYLQQRFQGRKTALRVVLFNDDPKRKLLSSEIDRARLQFQKTVEEMRPKGDFHIVAESGELAKQLELAIRPPPINVQQNSNNVAGLQNFPPERHLDWKGLKPGQYTISLFQQSVQDIRLHPGDWMILTLRRHPATHDLYFERSLFGAETGAHDAVNKGDWVATMLQRQDDRKYGVVRHLVALENNTTGGKVIQQVPPGFAWLEINPEDSPLRKLTWRRDYSYPAPTLRAEALGWPSQGLRRGTAGASVWWTGTPYPDSKAYVKRTPRNPAQTLHDNFVSKSGERVGSAIIRIEDVAEERRPVRGGPEPARAEQSCLVVRIHHDNKKPVFVQLIGADRSFAEEHVHEEHLYYPEVNRYTAVFWNIPNITTARFLLNIVSLDDFKAAVEPAVFRQFIPDTLAAPKPVPLAVGP